EVVHIVVAVTARLIFEALQRYRRAHPEGKPLPTVLVLEEAHSFIKKGGDIDAFSPSHLCRETFERIAREGRKFGLGLVLSSQPQPTKASCLSSCPTMSGGFSRNCRACLLDKLSFLGGRRRFRSSLRSMSCRMRTSRSRKTPISGMSGHRNLRANCTRSTSPL